MPAVRLAPSRKAREGAHPQLFRSVKRQTRVALPRLSGPPASAYNLTIMTEQEPPGYNLDATTFQEPLVRLAEVLAQKVKREGPSKLPAPGFVAIDLHVLIRQAMHTYNLLFYLNADERRETDFNWRNVYTMVSLPLIRNMIDCLYNITAILEAPAANGAWFRKSGFHRTLAAFDEDEKRYGGQPKWDSWIERNRKDIDFKIRECGLTMSDVKAQTISWPTLGKYINDRQRGGGFTTHQTFLRTFVYLNWRQYSAMAHGAFEGLIPVAMYYIADSMPLEDRAKLDEIYPLVLAMHFPRIAAVLLCIVTGMQAYFHFDDDGARINERIHKMWDALMPVLEVKELYDERYAQLMKDKRINP